FFQAEDGIRDYKVTGVQTCALPIYVAHPLAAAPLLAVAHRRAVARLAVRLALGRLLRGGFLGRLRFLGRLVAGGVGPERRPLAEIGRASGRERGWRCGGVGGWRRRA